MAWLGNQFNTLTTKLTDLTKDVLTENVTSDFVDDLSKQNGILSSKELAAFCNEKDKKIQELTQKNENLERSIEELDQQHQEAINSLLQVKNVMQAENNTLKETLSKQKASEIVTFPCSDFFLLSKDIQMMLGSSVNTESETSSYESSKENVNLLELLKLFAHNCTIDDLQNKLKQLEIKKQSRSSSIKESDKDSDILISKYSHYISFLEIVINNYNSLFPVIKEMCSASNLLITNIVQLSQKLDSVNSEQSKSIDLCYSDQLLTSTNECINHDFGCQTSVFLTTDSTVQTDCMSPISKEDLQNCCSQFTQTDINLEEISEMLMHDKRTFADRNLQKEKCELKTEILNLTLANKNSFTTSTQTDSDFRCNCETLTFELNSSKIKIDELKTSYENRLKEESDNLNDVKEKYNVKESVIIEKDNVIQSQKQEIVSLISKINSLKREIKSLQEKETSEEKENVKISQIKTDYSLPVSEDTALNTKVSSLEMEKSRLLCVLNEKSQECSSLKAEVHKLTNIVASEKQALLKLQQDNCDLRFSNKESSDLELTKETIKKLSTMIRDKDFEIESLKQKNATLTTLIQDATHIPEHLQSLMDEKENLSKQVKLFKTDKDKFMLTYNTKDKECRKFAAEIKELNSALSQQREKFDILEQKHFAVAQQYEEKQKSLINTQNEMIALKQRVSYLEQQQADIKEKYSHLLNKINSESTIQITKDELKEKNEKIEQLVCSTEEKDHLIQEKDCIIHDLSQHVKALKLELEQQKHTMQCLEKKISELMDKIVDLKNSTEQLESDKLVLEQKVQDKTSESALLKDMNERLNMALKEKEFAFQSMTEKVTSLSQYINSDHSSGSAMDINQILADSEAMFSKAQHLYRERDESLLALNQCKQENQNLRNEIQRMKSNEIHQGNELERLRKHLIEIEENYTNEALKSEEKQKRLQDELVEVKRRAEINSTAVVDTNQRATIQIASLQEQLSIIANQRDEALSQISSLEDKVLQNSTAVEKLQLVLEQMKRNNDKKVKDIEHKSRKELENQKFVCKKLEEEVCVRKRQLEESSQALEAATRLSEQLDAKEEVIANLKEELFKTEHKIRSTAQEIDSMKSNTEGKVDRVVMKSLVLGYFSTPPGQKSEVIRLLARVLDFNQEEMEKAGIVVGKQTKQPENKSLLSSIFSRLPSMSSERNPRQPEKSFTTLFVQFLENESQPIVPMPFPIEKMTQELSQKAHHSSKRTTNSQISPRKSPLLMDIDSAFPTFTPLPALEFSPTPAPTILREVLE